MRSPKALHVQSAGRVRVKIWHDVHHGATRFNVAFTKLPADDERWWDSTCFERDDMPALARLAEHANLWIDEQLHGESHPSDDKTADGSS